MSGLSPESSPPPGFSGCSGCSGVNGSPEPPPQAAIDKAANNKNGINKIFFIIYILSFVNLAFCYHVPHYLHFIIFQSEIYGLNFILPFFALAIRASSIALGLTKWFVFLFRIDSVLHEKTSYHIFGRGMITVCDEAYYFVFEQFRRNVNSLILHLV